MSDAKRDNNYVPTLTGVSNADASTPTLVYVDPATGRLLVNSTGTIEETGHAALSDLVTTVTTAGTAVQLASNACKRVVVQALSDNEDAIQVGSSNVKATSEATQRGVRLFPTQSVMLMVDNTNLIYIDAAVDTDGVSVYFEN